MTAVDTPIRTQYPVHYKTVRVNNLDIFYREAGRQEAPVILLLHGFPTSSNMFRNLIPRLAGSFHVVAPDYPGFGQSSMPDHTTFRVHLRELRQHHERFCRVARVEPVLPVCDGLRRPRWLPPCPPASRTYTGFDRAEWQCLRRGTPRILGLHQEVLGRSDSGKPGRAALPCRSEVHSMAVRKRRAGHLAGRPDHLARRSGRPRPPWKSRHPDGSDVIPTAPMCPSTPPSRHSSGSISRQP